MHVGFADEHRPGGFQAADHFGVFRRDAVFVDGAGGGGADARGVDAVLDADGNAVQRAAEASGGLFFRQRFGLRERFLAQDGDPRVGLGIPRLDGRETGFGEIERREFFGADTGRGLLQSQGAQFVWGIGEGGSGGDEGSRAGREKVAAGGLWHVLFYRAAGGIVKFGMPP